MRDLFKPSKPYLKGEEELKNLIGKTIQEIKVEQYNGWFTYKAVITLVFTDGTETVLTFRKGNV